ncbi:MAG TPA: molybdopterin cofactor-binding domain-containing protein [Novosphingobium sp.]|nr:molybdopterin cofactor-binding domain-containing protein [Novosphingobium sp.]
MRVTRRGLLIGAGAGGLLVAWSLTPRRFAIPLEAGSDEVAFDAWLKLGTDGVVTVAVPQLEMGQGVSTLIPQVVAAELGADWRQVAVEMVPVSGAYANVPLAARWAKLWMPLVAGAASSSDSRLARRFAEANNFTATADGTSLAAYEAPAREAAASVRAMLAMAAADRWVVGWEECGVAGGFVTHGKQRLTFGELAQEAAEYDPPDPPPLRPAPMAERAADFPPGAPLRYPRLDLPSKVDGSHLFAGDVRLPDMLFAAIRHGPIGDTTLASFDAARAKSLPGLVRLVKGQRWLAAVASDWWSAESALSAIAPNFTTRHRADTIKIEQALDRALRKGDADTIAEVGDPEGVFGGKFSLARRYEVAPALHATLETASATARLRGGKLELWAACQAPEAARLAAARALGMSARDVVLYPMPAGGSFDRRLEHEHVTQAALIAREVGKPVQLTWSRWQEHLAGLPRTPVVAVLAAKTAPSGEVLAWKTRIAAPASFREFGQRLFGGERAFDAAAAQDSSDAMAVEGAVPPYALPNLIVEHVPVAIPLPTGRMRGNAHGFTTFFTESFVDELAHLGGREPLSYRMAMLGHDLRLANCLQRAATLAEWGGGADSSGQGLACHVIGGGRIAVVASARRDETGVRVDKLTAVADIGRIVNLDIARQQIEGGLVFGLGLALGCSTGYANGLPTDTRLGALDLPVLADCPEIEVDFIESAAEPADPGELGVAVVAPAIANALFSATGLRFRKLPLLSEEV